MALGKHRPANQSSRLWRWGNIDLQSYLPDFGAGQTRPAKEKLYFKDKTKTIINYKKKYEIYLDDLINTENIQENFTNFFESSVNPINDETNSPKSYTNIFNFKNKLWEKKIINISLWVFLYILIILFIFAIVISFIK